MGYITVTGDSDGDLHDAEMHNAKFGAISSVINGNISHDNLLYPSGEFIITASALTNGAAWYRFASSTSGVPTAESANATSGNLHAPVSSIIRIPFTGTFTDNVTVTVCKKSGYTTGNNLSFVLQKSSSAGGTYANVGNLIYDDCDSASSFELATITLTGTTGQTITAGNYIRLLVTNNTTGSDYPPTLTMTARIKTLHV
jgi:hypothetical protein